MRAVLQQAALLASAAMLLALPRSAPAEADTQLWSEVKLTAKWGDRMDLIAASALRFADDLSHHDRTSYQLGFNFDATTQLTVTPSYQSIATDPSDDVRSFEHRFSLVAALRVPFEWCEATFSTGLEYRLRHEQADGWRLRPRLKLKRTVGPDAWGVAAYTADELFYDTRADEWTRNRLFVGIEKKLRRNWVLDLYYCRQYHLHSGDPDLHVIGISMRLSPDTSASDSRNASEGS